MSEDYDSDSDGRYSSSHSDRYDSFLSSSEDYSSDTSDSLSYSPIRNFNVDELSDTSTDSSSSSGVSYSRIDCYGITPTSVPKLKEMASVSVAVALWNHINIPHTATKISGDKNYTTLRDTSKWDLLLKIVRKSTNELPVPKQIAEYVKTYVNVVQHEIDKWVEYHFETVFFKKYATCAFVYCQVNDIIWHPNGTIDYKQTAKNLIKSHRLSNIVKYRLLCMYCLKEEMAQMSPLEFINDETNRKDTYYYPLLNYWNCYFKNELNKICLDEGIFQLDFFMFQHRYVDNWPAKEYFFERMSSNDQVQAAIGLIDKHGVKYQSFLLKKLNEVQRLHVYLDKAAEIITNYARTEVNYDDVVSTWLDIRNLITQKQFVSIFKKLLKLRTSGVVLQDIWKNVSDDFKRYLLKHHQSEIIEKMFKYWSRESIRDALFAMLSDASAEVKSKITKRKFFRNCCKELLTRNNLPNLNRLLNICLNQVDELARFKLDLASESKFVRNKCLDYYSAGRLIDLNEFLTQLLSPNPNHVILEYKRNILVSPDGISRCVDYLFLKKDTLNEIIADVSSSDDLATELKKKIIFSSSAVSQFKRKISNSLLNETKKCIDRYLSSNEDKKTLKQQLISNRVELLRKIILRCNQYDWQSLMVWFFEDEKTIQEIKCTLPLSEIFNELLKKAFDEPKVEFASMDRFLSWYFESPKAVKKYKLEKIDSHRRIDVIERLLKKKDTKSTLRLKALMSWFFENDVEQIYKFEKNHKDSKIGKIVRLVRKSEFK